MGSGSGSARRSGNPEPKVIDSTRGHRIGATCPRSGCGGMVTHRLTQPSEGVNYIYRYSQCSRCYWKTLND
jgi:hypothetical protein